MATKERHKVIQPGAHTTAGVERYAKDYGVSVSDAWSALAQYALNRIATLARNAAKKPKPAKVKGESKKANAYIGKKVAERKAKAATERAEGKK